MTTSSRGYHHGDLRGAILRTAGKLLEKQGIEGLKLRALARRSKVSHNAPYRHFPEREALLAALAAEGFEMLGQAQQAAAATGGMRAMGEAYVRFALAHPQRFRLMFGAQIAVARHPRLREVATRVCEALAGALSAKVPEAQTAKDSSVAAWALVHGLAQLLLGGRLPAAAKRDRDDAALVREVLASVRFAGAQIQSPA